MVLGREEGRRGAGEEGRREEGSRGGAEGSRGGKIAVFRCFFYGFCEKKYIFLQVFKCFFAKYRFLHRFLKVFWEGVIAAAAATAADQLITLEL